MTDFESSDFLRKCHAELAEASHRRRYFHLGNTPLSDRTPTDSAGTATGLVKGHNTKKTRFVNTGPAPRNQKT
jgi:hypothetical protein